MIVGGRFGGWSFLVLDGRPVLAHAMSEQDRYKFRLTAPEPLGPGRFKLAYDVRYERGRGGGPAEVSILVDGRPVASGRFERTLPRGYGSGGETFDIGRDTGTPVLNDYAVPFAFSGVLGEVVVELAPVRAP